MAGIAWPDILIGGILLLAGLKGYKRGFILELAGAIALICSLVTPWFYNGAFDTSVAAFTHTGPGSAHVIAMAFVGIATYVGVMIVARVLSAIAKLPILGFGNALAGAAVGLAKGVCGLWIVLYIALFFPLSRDIRADLHRSTLARAITAPNQWVDGALDGTLPAFARQVTDPIFQRHKV